MLRFEEVAEIPDSEMRAICQMMPVDTLAKALNAAPSRVVDKFLNNTPATPAALIRDLMAKHKKITDDEIRSSRESIAGIIARMRTG